MKVVVGAQAEVMVADIAPADDGRVAVCDQKFVVHAGIQPFHPGNHLSGARERAAFRPGIEQAKLDVLLPLQFVEQLVLAGRQQVIDDEAYFHAAASREYGSLEDQAAAVVRVPEVSLDVERRHGRVDQGQAVVECVSARIQQHETGVFRPVLPHDVVGHGPEDAVRSGLHGIGFLTYRCIFPQCRRRACRQQQQAAKRQCAEDTRIRAPRTGQGGRRPHRGESPGAGCDPLPPWGMRQGTNRISDRGTGSELSHSTSR